ncbi:MAG: hypothetical protein ACPG49_01885 [Chitinophagales bacterium]
MKNKEKIQMSENQTPQNSDNFKEGVPKSISAIVGLFSSMSLFNLIEIVEKKNSIGVFAFGCCYFAISGVIYILNLVASPYFSVLLLFSLPRIIVPIIILVSRFFRHILKKNL